MLIKHYSFGVLYSKAGQTSEEDMFSNSTDFLAIGTKGPFLKSLSQGKKTPADLTKTSSI